MEKSDNIISNGLTFNINNIMDYLQKDYWNEDEKRMNSYHDVISMHAYIAYRVMDIERKKELKKLEELNNNDIKEEKKDVLSEWIKNENEKSIKLYGKLDLNIDYSVLDD